MKKVIQTIVAAILSVATMGSFASAASCDGTIAVTGPGSNNVIKCTDVNNLVVTCTNNAYVANVNYQDANSGQAGVGGNTLSGSASSGNVTNDNGQNVQLGSSCGQAAPAPGGGAVTAAAAPAPGKGAIAPQPAPGKGAAMLPYTAGDSLAKMVIGTIIAAGSVLGVSRIGISAFRRYGDK